MPLPRNEKRLAVPAFSLAVIVPVAGVVGVPPTASVNWVGEMTVTVWLPLYAFGSAPAITTTSPVRKP